MRTLASADAAAAELERLIAAPELRELVIRSDRLRDVSAIVAMQCPRLARLERWFGEQDQPDVAPLIADGVLPSFASSPCSMRRPRSSPRCQPRSSDAASRS